MTVERDFVPSRIKTLDPLHEPWQLTEAQREVFRVRSRDSRAARQAALAGTAEPSRHPVNVPTFEPTLLMPQREANGLASLSMFSGGGGLDLGFDRAGFAHGGSWEILDDAATTLRAARPQWRVHGGGDGDVRGVDWRGMRGEAAVVHGGPPCQPFSNAGKRRGSLDPRDMWPEFVRAVLAIRPDVFVAENVAALASKSFSDYVADTITGPLGRRYEIHRVILEAHEFGVPQVRRRVVFVGFAGKRAARRWTPPRGGFHRGAGVTAGSLPVIGAREALGLPDIGFDDVAPTIRSGLSGPRHTTSVLNSVSALRRFEALQIWPNGVAPTREAARAFAVKNGHFRLSVSDVALLQGFPETWPFAGATYMRLGQIGNSVVPPVAYAVASSVADALLK